MEITPIVSKFYGATPIPSDLYTLPAQVTKQSSIDSIPNLSQICWNMAHSLIVKDRVFDHFAVLVEANGINCCMLTSYNNTDSQHFAPVCVQHMYTE